LPGLHELGVETLIRFHVLMREDIDLAVEADTEGVEGRDFLDFFGFGTSAVLGILALALMRSLEDGM
jgi:hypothetical protein